MKLSEVRITAFKQSAQSAVASLDKSDFWNLFRLISFGVCNHGLLQHDLSALNSVADPDRVLDAIRGEGLRLAGILTTHSDWDHAGGNEEIRDRACVPPRARSWRAARARPLVRGLGGPRVRAPSCAVLAGRCRRVTALGWQGWPGR
jgi:glyoxylase-like metal-dependent hydrolase (beta-lactamase superfamily II)